RCRISISQSRRKPGPTRPTLQQLRDGSRLSPGLRFYLLGNNRMSMGEHDRDYFDFNPAPPPETEGVERPEGEDDPALLEPVLEALKTVQEPEIPVNLVELGLIYELTVKKGGIVYVEMTLTTPACPV